MLLVGATALLLPANAYAYLDAGTGSMLLQVLLGGAVGLMVLVRMYWRRLIKLFKGNKDTPEALAATAEPAAPTDTDAKAG
jgi:hypothetical protein